MARAINRVSRGTNLYIADIDADPAEYLEIQFVPELSYQPKSRFVAIASMGRNADIYHYTGASDTLEFSLDWFAQEESRIDVIQKCKWVEALSKNDGFQGPPHRVKLYWGHGPEEESELLFPELFLAGAPYMFNDATWLVTAAPYNLSLFHKQHSNLPQQAIQQITLTRILTRNSTHESIKRINT